MPLIKEGKTVSKDAADAAEADAQKSSQAALEEDTGAVLDEPNPGKPEPARQEVAARSESGAVTSRAGGTQSLMKQMEEEGFGGGHIDFTSFTNIVLKDGEFQLVGTTKSFSATAGFDGVVMQSQAKWAMRVGGDDDADVVFAYSKAEFNDPESEVGAKVAEWRADGLKPELKEYAELFVMIEAVHADECQELVGDAVVVQVSPMSTGRWAGFKFKNRGRHGLNPDGYVTKFVRGEKVTAAKFPFYPWDFKFVRVNA